MTAPEYRIIGVLEGLWKTKARRIGLEFGFRWAFFRAIKGQDEMIESFEKEEMVATCEVIETKEPLAKFTGQGVELREQVWEVAGGLNAISGIPLMVVVIASDGAAWAKVTEFPKAGPRVVPAAAFRALPW